MLRDFGVKLNIPEDRLCPPVPNRMNYALWIQDIIRQTWSITGSESHEAIRGIDMFVLSHSSWFTLQLTVWKWHRRDCNIPDPFVLS